MVYGGDFDENGSYESVLAYKNNNEYLPVRGRECSSGQLPYIAEEFTSYQAYAEANIEDIYGKENLKNGLTYSVTEFRSGILKNNKGKFEFEAFPIGAQTSWIRDFELEDVNKDGKMDILAVGNHMGAEVETTNYDAGVGVTLIQEEGGSFKYLMPYESGFYVHADTREIERIKLANGKVGFLVSVNQGTIKLFTYSK